MISKLLSCLTALCATSGAIELGSDLPAVSCPDQEGKTISLADYRSAKWVLVYFYPKADTPGCTSQACSLRDAFASLAEQNVTVFGVSKDTPASQKKFREKYKLPFSLLADTEGTVIKSFAVPTYPGVGLSKRQAFLFQKGKLVWSDLSASTTKQAADVLSVISKKQP